MNRAENLARLEREFDVLVIGGGATGLGVAVDAATRGYRTALLEAYDFAQGTSSRSTKLVHGGVRYLQQGNIGLVREALRERGLMLRSAPHLVSALSFLVPAYKWWELPFYGAGLTFYDILAGSLGLARTRFVGPRAATRLVPTVRRAGLKGGVVYSDAQFDDARYALALARAASERGAVLINYAPVRAILRRNGRTAGAVFLDQDSGQEHEVQAKAVINATGVFSDEIRKLDDPAAEPLIAASQGIHVVLDRSFLLGDAAVMVPHTDDGRVVFIIPWQGRALAGTTDTPVAGPSIEPMPTRDEVAFVIEHVGRYLERQPKENEVLSVFAGLRPLVKGRGISTAALSRDHTLLVSRSGLVTITGGKWTTYRRMAEDAVDTAARVAGLPRRPGRTRYLRLPGGEASDPRWRELGASAAEAESYDARFPGHLHPRLPYSLGMVAYAVEHEMPYRLEDVLSRRLRALILDARAAAEAAPRVAEIMASLQGRDDVWIRKEVDGFLRLAQRYLVDDIR